MSTEKEGMPGSCAVLPLDPTAQEHDPWVRLCAVLGGPPTPLHGAGSKLVVVVVVWHEMLALPRAAGWRRSPCFFSRLV